MPLKTLDSRYCHSCRPWQASTITNSSNISSPISQNVQHLLASESRESAFAEARSLGSFSFKISHKAHGYAHLAVWNHGSTGTSSIFHLTCAARSSWLYGFHKASWDQNSSKLRHSGWKLDSFHGMNWMSFGRACSSSCLSFALQISPSHSPHCELEHGHWPISPLHQHTWWWALFHLQWTVRSARWAFQHQHFVPVEHFLDLQHPRYPGTQVGFPWDPFPGWKSPSPCWSPPHAPPGLRGMAVTTRISRTWILMHGLQKWPFCIIIRTFDVVIFGNVYIMGN